MKFRTCRLSDDDLTMQEWVFAFAPEALTLRLVTYRENHRTHENANWRELRLWKFSIEDFTPPVEVPDWALAEIKNQVASNIKLA